VETPAAEVVEGRPGTKENAMPTDTWPTLCGISGVFRVRGVREESGRISLQARFDARLRKESHPR
jgi:hypothetical protein